MIIPFHEIKKREAVFRLLKCTKGSTSWYQIDEKIGGEWHPQQQFPLDKEPEARERFNFLSSDMLVEILEEK